jgi:hypothetical protein
VGACGCGPTSAAPVESAASKGESVSAVLVSTALVLSRSGRQDSESRAPEQGSQTRLTPGGWEFRSLGVPTRPANWLNRSTAHGTVLWNAISCLHRQLHSLTHRGFAPRGVAASRAGRAAEPQRGAEPEGRAVVRDRRTAEVFGPFCATARPRALHPAAAAAAAVLRCRLPYSDEKCANRDIRVWHLVIENGY